LSYVVTFFIFVCSILKKLNIFLQYSFLYLLGLAIPLSFWKKNAAFYTALMYFERNLIKWHLLRCHIATITKSPSKKGRLQTYRNIFYFFLSSINPAYSILSLKFFALYCYNFIFTVSYWPWHYCFTSF